MIKSTSFDDFLEEQLKDPEVKKEYDKLENEYQIRNALVKARAERNMSQKELAKKTGLYQGDISKLEKGLRNPTVRMLNKIADGLGMVLKIEFVPKI